jgi:transposase
MSLYRKQYDAEFKHNAVHLADSSGKSDFVIERELGIYQGAIHAWRKAMKEDSEEAFPGTGHMKSADDELRRLRRELEEVRQERDILKKAMAIFSKDR